MNQNHSHLPMTPTEKVEKQLSTVRKKKLSKLKKKIESGKYSVSNFDLAKALFMSQ